MTYDTARAIFQSFPYLRGQTPSCHAAEVHSTLGLAVDAYVPFAARHPRSRGATSSSITTSAQARRTWFRCFRA
jgi:hypothetical protein